MSPRPVNRASILGRKVQAVMTKSAAKWTTCCVCESAEEPGPEDIDAEFIIPELEDEPAEGTKLVDACVRVNRGRIRGLSA